MPTIADLLKLADEGEAADFQDAVSEILAQKTNEKLDELIGAAPLGEAADDEDLDALDAAPDEDGDDDEELTEEELQEIADTITEEDYEALDDDAKAALAKYMK